MKCLARWSSVILLGDLYQSVVILVLFAIAPKPRSQFLLAPPSDEGDLFVTVAAASSSSSYCCCRRFSVVIQLLLLLLLPLLLLRFLPNHHFSCRDGKSPMDQQGSNVTSFSCYKQNGIIANPNINHATNVDNTLFFQDLNKTKQESNKNLNCKDARVACCTQYLSQRTLWHVFSYQIL
ncbi:unnamed protein product [Sphagnum tenellum]